jgi:ankyrin repeat protein
MDWDIGKTCARDHREELQKVLQQSGLDVNWAHPADGSTAAHVATELGHGECLSMIIQYGADLAKKTKEAPIHVACRTGRIACLALILDSGVGVNVWTAGEGVFTPVMICSVTGHVKCLALLLDRKADPDLADRTGLTAVHTACLYGQVQCLQLLIARRANINARAGDGKTPLDCARTYGHAECVELLLDKYAVGMRVEDIPTISEADKVRPYLLICPYYTIQPHPVNILHRTKTQRP